MGRTNPTFRTYLQQYEQDWQSFRRGLRHADQQRFDRLFERARQYADAASYVNARDPELAVLLSMLLAQEAELETLRDRITSLEDDVQS